MLWKKNRRRKRSVRVLKAKEVGFCTAAESTFFSSIQIYRGDCIDCVDTLERDSSGELDARPKRNKRVEVEEEVGPIKESLVGKAQSVRAARRKGKGIGDTEILDDFEQAEELKEMPDAEKEKEHGIELEAFNLEVCS